MRTKRDPLASAVEALRARELRLRALEDARRDVDRLRHAADVASADSLRAELAEVAAIADLILRAWLMSDRFALARRASPAGTDRSVELGPLRVLNGIAHFLHEHGEHRGSRGKRYVVNVGEPIRFRWSASGLGGAGGGAVAIEPRSFADLARMDLAARVAWPGQEHDVLVIALRVAKLVAAGELEDALAASMIWRAHGEPRPSRSR